MFPSKGSKIGTTLLSHSHTVDGLLPAPPKKPLNDESPVNTNQHWFRLVSQWCEMDCVHQYGLFASICSRICFYFPSLVLQGIYHYRTYFLYFFPGVWKPNGLFASVAWVKQTLRLRRHVAADLRLAEAKWRLQPLLEAAALQAPAGGSEFLRVFTGRSG